MKLPRMKGYVLLDMDQRFYVRKKGHDRYDAVVAVGYAKDHKVYWYAFWYAPTAFMIAAQYERVQ